MRWLGKVRERGATELHIHRLAATEAERRAIFEDLRENENSGLLSERIDDPVQQRIDHAHADEMLVGRAHVIRVAARDALPLPHQPQHLLVGQPAGILPMLAVDHIGERADPTRIREPHGQAPLQIDRRDLLAVPQILDRGLLVLGGATRNATPWQRPPRSSPRTSPGCSGVPRWTWEKTQSER